jgi:hypothetical protein
LYEENEVIHSDDLEIEKENLHEFEQSTEHPDNTQINSEKLRYENADDIYG